jgi:hypothetical protein
VIRPAPIAVGQIFRHGRSGTSDCTAGLVLASLSFLNRSPASLRLTPSVEPDVVTGALRVRLPLPLPPGVPEGAPDLALVYGSAPASSIVGAGWSLSLPAAITVGPARGVPSWTSKDGYLFGGEPLVPWVQADGTPRAHVRDGVATQFWRVARCEPTYSRPPIVRK